MWVNAIVGAITAAWVVRRGVLLYGGINADAPGLPLLLFLMSIGVTVLGLGSRPLTIDVHALHSFVAGSRPFSFRSGFAPVTLDQTAPLRPQGAAEQTSRPPTRPATPSRTFFLRFLAASRCRIPGPCTTRAVRTAPTKEECNEPSTLSRLARQLCSGGSADAGETPKKALSNSGGPGGMIFDGLDPDRLVYSSGTCSTMTSKISSDGSAPTLRKSRGAAGASIAARILSRASRSLHRV